MMLEQLAPDELNSSVWAENYLLYSQSKAATLKVFDFVIN